MPFLTGLLCGLLLALIVWGAVAAWLYKRSQALQQRARQTERLAELGTLTGALAHEIKNPLSTVQLNLALLAEDLDPENPAHSRITHRLQTVQREAGRLREILDDFLKYAGKIELNREPVELNGLLEELADFFTPQAAIQKVALRVRRSEQPITASVDAKLLKQGILNLMINALHAMPQGGELILSLMQRGDAAQIDVIDTGTGISRTALPQIFNAYYTTKAGGTGLGLATTRKIIDEHGGQIIVKSDLGKGTDFSLHIPLV